MKQRAGNLNDKQLNGAQVVELETIADSATGWARNRAQAWLGLYDGRAYSNPVLLPVDDGQNMARSTQQSGALQGETFDNKVFPNPVDNQLNISWNSDFAKHMLYISDIYGRTLLTKKLNGKTGMETLDVSGFPGGIYLYKLEEGDRIVVTGKFVKK